MEENYEQSRSKGLRSDNYLRKVVTEKENRARKLEEIQNMKFMKKFWLLSDVNLCVGADFKDPDLEIPVSARKVI